jgi:UDP-N-acetylglucosamine--N-acetylmuramyl-(pentapeptide) pyrophosphoryl-undecaprenol N-acetylglucosamine transferase
VSELCIVGKPVIFIPSPNVLKIIKLKKAIVDKRSALLKESELESEFSLVLKRY